ncbi:MAG: DUF5312 family protein [Alkalispirochaetaceae bacterium]
MAGNEQQERTGSTFDLLARQLHPREREEMLRRVESAVTDSSEPLKQAETEEAVDLEASFAEFGVLRRLFVWVQVLLTGLDRGEAIERFLLKDLAHRIHQHDPELLDPRRRVFLDRFLKLTRELKDHARVLNPLLTRILGREKQAFIVYFASMELEEQHQQLLDDTDPTKGFTLESDVPERDIRAKLLGRLDGTLQSIPRILRQKITSSMRLVEMLFRLSAFPYDRIINQFQEYGDSESFCPFDLISEDVERLASIMAGLTDYPGMRVLQGAILFVYEEDEEGTQDSEAHLRKHLQQVLAAAEGIRGYNRSVPLGDIVRLIKRKRNYLIKPEGGGEEWFQIYHRFWKSRLDRLVNRFLARRKLQTVVKEASDLLETPKIQVPSFYPRRQNGEVALYGLAFSFINHFYTRLFPDQMETPIRTIYTDGEFYKQANRDQFNSTFNELTRWEERTRVLVTQLSNGGAIAETFRRLREEEENPTVRRRGINSQIESVEKDAQAIVEGTTTTLSILENLLNGILNARAGSAYDTLANRSQIGGSRNGVLLDEIDRCVTLSQEVRRVAGELMRIERNSYDPEVDQ